MYRLAVTYFHPQDPQKFLRHYREVHAVLAAELPGLRSFQWGVCESPDGSTPPYFVVATLDWDSKEDALAALSSEIGQQATADIANFTTPEEFAMTFCTIA